MSDTHPHDTPPVPVAWRPEVFGVPMLQRDSPFSYACHACKRCCQHYRIKANPYEVLRLARHLGLTTTAFIDAHLVDDAYLPHDEEGHCRFLGEQGCTVHPARPLVCRVYPLGLHVDGQGVERFSHLQPHPRTEGEYGATGTVDDYLRQQGAGRLELRRAFGRLRRKELETDFSSHDGFLRGCAVAADCAPRRA